MSKNRFALAVAVVLLATAPVLSQADANNQPDGDDSESDLTQDSYPEIYEGGDTDGSSSGGPLNEDPDDGIGSGDETGVRDFKICDNRSGETGRGISISSSGHLTIRSVQCD